MANLKSQAIAQEIEARFLGGKKGHIGLVGFTALIETHAFLAERALDAKTGVLPLTHLIAERVQEMLEASPEDTSTPG